MTPILYSFRRCPYAMRARMALFQSGTKLELREIVLRDKPEHMLEISPKGTVPVLQVSETKVIDESFDIMLWALNQNDPDDWLAGHDAALIAQNDEEFKAALDRYKYPNRYPDEDCSSARDDGEEFLKLLEARLQNAPYLCGDKKSLADIAIFPFIRQFANVDRDWFYALPYPALQAWLKSHLESDLFIAIMEKYKPWKEAGEAVNWPPIQVSA
jgi:glutathione S-transferase